ncbi:MAG: CDP-diacylglycerol--glycerol-3-phosphate 3-phosphatidyltransferase [Spirochaetales bacterium]|nr:CDP-diacylglycerol--glycerol-3-phosphate 3-phosphatidyltransferase [Spirochaetales bacterium]
MNLPNKITLVRILLSPAFFCVFYIPRHTESSSLLPLIFLWILFGVMEITDLIDGKIARKLGQISDTGKLLDPFADSLSRLTYFLCFTIAGVMEFWIFLIILYRDLGVSFVRLMIARKGIAMSARLSGKLKAVVYAISGIVGLAMMTLHKIPLSETALSVAQLVTTIFFIISAAVALWSLADYFSVLTARKRAAK